ncbi:MAG: LysR family transcriptional regulator [Pseudomonadota bacterium]
MDTQKLSLRWLEAFQAIARFATLREAAGHLNLAPSTVSHHLTCLEDALGTQLVDHTRRPMRLTQAGETLLRRVDEAMWLLKSGVSDIWSDDLRSLSRLVRIAHIEDFDTDVAPALVGHLSQVLPNCDLAMFSRPSHEIAQLIEREEIEVGLASTLTHDLAGVRQDGVARDPFILVVPKSLTGPVQDLAQLVSRSDDLPLLRYNQDQQIGRRIEAQFARQGLRFPKRMAFESTHAILALVAAGRGWAVTSALTFARAQRYHSHVTVLPMPGPGFARDITLLTRDSLPSSIRQIIETTVRGALQHLVIEPTLARYPWMGAGLVMRPHSRAI